MCFERTEAANSINEIETFGKIENNTSEIGLLIE